MRINVLADPHIDLKFNDWTPPPDIRCDVVVVAGDTGAPATAWMHKLREWWPDKRIVAVLGNHCFYSHHDDKRPELKTTWERQRADAPRLAESLGIDLLDDRAIKIDGVRFLGATLWTDMQMRPHWMSFDDAVRGAMRMNDYRATKTGAGGGKDRLRPRDTIYAHRQSRKFIEDTLAVPFDGETVVVTHHAPSRQSLRNPEALSDLDWCYASDLESIMTGPDAPTLWIHGHIHKNQDYTIGGTRVVCNPRGYPKYWLPNAPRENPNFDPTLVVEIGHDYTPKFGGM
jgi:Icc-related predicted phosphoesterase